MNPIEFTVIGIPATAGSKRSFPFKRSDGSLGVNTTEDCKRSKPWRSQVAWEALQAYSGSIMPMALRLEIAFYLPRPKGHFRVIKKMVSDQLKPGAPKFPTVKPDTVKMTRCLEDALKGVIWRDDSQVVKVVASKFYGEPARAEVRISVVE